MHPSDHVLSVCLFYFPDEELYHELEIYWKFLKRSKQSQSEFSLIWATSESINPNQYKLYPSPNVFICKQCISCTQCHVFLNDREGFLSHPRPVSWIYDSNYQEHAGE